MDSGNNHSTRKSLSERLFPRFATWTTPLTPVGAYVNQCVHVSHSLLCYHSQRCLQQNYVVEAEMHADRAIELVPSRAEAFFLRGQARLMLEKYQVAFSDFFRSRSLDPSFEEAAKREALKAHSKIEEREAPAIEAEQRRFSVDDYVKLGGKLEPSMESLNGCVGRIVEVLEDGLKLKLHVDGCDSFITVSTASALKLFDTYFVAPSAGKDLGMFALRNIKKGEIVIVEQPLLHTAGGQDEFEKVFSQLRLPDRSAFLGLHNAHKEEGSEAYGKWLSNRIAVVEEEKAIFPVIARINHACRANVFWEFEASEGLEYVYALRDISKGEEIFSNYFGEVCFDERQEKFSSIFGFKCQCALCSMSPSGQRQRDTMIARMLELDGRVSAMESQPLEEFQPLIEEALELVKIVAPYREWGVAHDMFRLASATVPLCPNDLLEYWGARQYQLSVELRGEHNPTSKRAKMYADDPLRLAFETAFMTDNLENVQTTLERGLKVDQGDDGGRTPFYIAAQTGNVPILRLLYAAKCDIDKPNKHDVTPCSIAARQGQIEVLKLLRQWKADLTKPNDEGLTPLVVAQQSGQTEAVRFLEDWSLRRLAE